MVVDTPLRLTYCLWDAWWEEVMYWNKGVAEHRVLRSSLQEPSSTSFGPGLQSCWAAGLTWLTQNNNRPAITVRLATCLKHLFNVPSKTKMENISHFSNLFQTVLNGFCSEWTNHSAEGKKTEWISLHIMYWNVLNILFYTYNKI